MISTSLKYKTSKGYIKHPNNGLGGQDLDHTVGYINNHVVLNPTTIGNRRGFSSHIQPSKYTSQIYPFKVFEGLPYSPMDPSQQQQQQPQMSQQQVSGQVMIPPSNVQVGVPTAAPTQPAPPPATETAMDESMGAEAMQEDQVVPDDIPEQEAENLIQAFEGVPSNPKTGESTGVVATGPLLVQTSPMDDMDSVVMRGRYGIYDANGPVEDENEAKTTQAINVINTMQGRGVDTREEQAQLENARAQIETVYRQAINQTVLGGQSTFTQQPEAMITNSILNHSRNDMAKPMMMKLDDSALDFLNINEREMENMMVDQEGETEEQNFYRILLEFSRDLSTQPQSIIARLIQAGRQLSSSSFDAKSLMISLYKLNLSIPQIVDYFETIVQEESMGVSTNNLETSSGVPLAIEPAVRPSAVLSLPEQTVMTIEPAPQILTPFAPPMNAVPVNSGTTSETIVPKVPPITPMKRDPSNEPEGAPVSSRLRSKGPPTPPSITAKPKAIQTSFSPTETLRPTVTQNTTVGEGGSVVTKPARQKLNIEMPTRRSERVAKMVQSIEKAQQKSPDADPIGSRTRSKSKAADSKSKAAVAKTPTETAAGLRRSERISASEPTPEPTNEPSSSRPKKRSERVAINISSAQDPPPTPRRSTRLQSKKK